MARKGRLDRGLVQRKDTTGKLVWHVRLYHNGSERQFGSFANKTKARDFYEKAKLEQKEGRFFPERYQRGGYETVQEIIDRYIETLAGKKATTIADEKRYAVWWKERLAGKRLNQVTAGVLEEVKRELASKGRSLQTIVHYLKFLRHVLYAVVGKTKLHENPFEKAKLPKVRAGRTRFVSLEEERRLCEAIGARYAPWVRLAILTGLRKSEQFGFTLDRSGSRSRVDHTPRSKVWVRAIRASDGRSQNNSPWYGKLAAVRMVFPSENSATHLDVHNFYGRIFLPAVKVAKLGTEWVTARLLSCYGIAGPDS